MNLKAAKHVTTTDAAWLAEGVVKTGAHVFGGWRQPSDEMKGTLEVHEKTAVANSKETQLDELAERVGFEPTCPLLAGKTLSRRPRYDHFGTSPA